MLMKERGGLQRIIIKVMKSFFNIVKICKRNALALDYYWQITHISNLCSWKWVKKDGKEMNPKVALGRNIMLRRTHTNVERERDEKKGMLSNAQIFHRFLDDNCRLKLLPRNIKRIFFLFLVLLLSNISLRFIL